MGSRPDGAGILTQGSPTLTTTSTEAAVLRQANGPLGIETLEIEQPRGDEVLVRMVGVGVCHTDLGVIATAQEGQLPVVLGHEGSGVVEAVGPDVRDLAPGDHVVLTFNFCGKCDNCRQGLQVHCRDFAAINLTGARLDGSSPLSTGGQSVFGHFFGQSSFARHAITTERNAIKVGDDLPLEILGPLGCGIQTGAGAVLNTLAPKEGDSIAIFAVGSVGLAALLASVAAGCSPIIAVDPLASRRELAESLGATHTVDPTGEDAAERIREITGGVGARFSVDAIGLAPVVKAALECLQSPGTCATVGFQGMSNELTIDQGHLLFGRSLVGVIEGDAIPAEFIPRMIEMYRSGRFAFDRLISTYPFEDVNRAIDDVHHGKVVKAVLTF